jgi:protein TonB
MTSGTKPRLGEVVAFARAGDGRADDLLGAVVPARLREEPTGPAPANVVPFIRPRSNDNTKPTGPELVVTGRPAPVAAAQWTVARKALFITASLLVHGAMFAALWRDPPELAGTELESISVEILLGNNAPRGLAQAPSEIEGDIHTPSPVETQTSDQVEQVQERTTEQPQEVKVAEQEVAPPPQPTLQAETRPETQPVTEPEPTPVVEAPKPEANQSVAMVETPQAEIPTEAPRAEPPPPEKLALLPQPQAEPEQKPVEPPKVEAKPVPPKPEPPKREPAKPVKQEQKKKKDAERTRIAARTDERTREREAGAPSRQGSNGAPARAGSSFNYNGQVSAHLQRYKQYPSDARSRGDSGSATVAFTLDGGGRVTSVRLAGSSGHASLDQEVQAMVRRASPFPAPPDGRSHSFSQSIGFGIRTR